MPRADMDPIAINAIASRQRAQDVSLVAELNGQVAGIVHDLGNLIQIALSAINIATRTERYEATAAEPALVSAKASLERAGVLVREVVGIARDASVDCVCVASCLSEIKTLVHGAWGPDVRLDVRMDADLPTAKCSRLGLQNAVLNLVFNARDAMPAGGVIAVTATDVSSQSSAPELELCVSDNGIGMTKEMAMRAFDPFFTTKCTGLGGVGLPMVSRFVQEARGRIAIESEPGVGTTVTLRLPACAPTAGPLGTYPCKPASQPSSFSPAERDIRFGSARGGNLS
jgi:signal transduction histidine kinase